MDHVKGNANINEAFLLGWLRRIDCLWIQIEHLPINHIKREYNQPADLLSKKGLLSGMGKVQIVIYMEAQQSHSGFHLLG